jgi:hypothetical protein
MWSGQGLVDAVCSTVAQAAEAELIKNKGVVINVSSGVAIAAAPGPAMAPYFIAKASQVGIAHEACTHRYRWCTLQQQSAWQPLPGRRLAVALHRCMCCNACSQQALAETEE